MEVRMCLTMSVILEATGLSPKEFRVWCESGVVLPVTGGTGKGNRRHFTRMQVVGMAVAANLRKGDLRCPLPYVGKVVSYIGSLTEGKLLAEFEAGRTLLLPDDPPRLIEPVRWQTSRDEFDVRLVYQRTTKCLAG